MCDRCIEFGGRFWHKRKSRDYYVALSYLHREIWASVNGPIPKGFEVHHKNGDKTDNRIENLQLLSTREHRSHHAEQFLRTPEAKVKAAVNSLATRQKNASEREGRDLRCCICNRIYHSRAKHPRRFCSQRCIDKARSRRHEPDAGICEHCAKGYRRTKRNQRYCSKRCRTLGLLVVSALEPSPPRTIRCAYCNKPFLSARRNARFDTRECALRFHDAHRFRGKVADHR